MQPTRVVLVVALVVSSVMPSDAGAADLSSRAKVLIRTHKYAEAVALLMKGDATAEERYQLARALALLRRTHPCEALLETVRDTLASALEDSPRLRQAARSDPAFAELQGTCMVQRLVAGLDVANPQQLRRLVERVAWEGTNWGTNGPGPQDSLELRRGKVTLSAQRVHDGCPISGRYRLEGTRLHIEGVCRMPGQADLPVTLDLTLDPEWCTLSDGDGTRLFDDTPDECNT
jgi:hypothetical protein